jgi:hypothetical protein
VALESRKKEEKKKQEENTQAEAKTKRAKKKKLRTGGTRRDCGHSGPQRSHGQIQTIVQRCFQNPTAVMIRP